MREAKRRRRPGVAVRGRRKGNERKKAQGRRDEGRRVEGISLVVMREEEERKKRGEGEKTHQLLVSSRAKPHVLRSGFEARTAPRLGLRPAYYARSSCR
jgi:hypothetical protein